MQIVALLLFTECLMVFRRFENQLTQITPAIADMKLPIRKGAALRAAQGAFHK